MEICESVYMSVWISETGPGVQLSAADPRPREMLPWTRAQVMAAADSTCCPATG